MIYLTTYFDNNYLSRGLLLYGSLKKYCNQFTLYILCLDNSVLDYFINNSSSFPEVIALSLCEIEEKDTELMQCKVNRSKIEYYFTLSPCLPLFLLEKYKIPHVCSLDADILFFSDPNVIFSYLENYSILITPHNFSKDLKHKEIYGKYNVSFQIFKNDSDGIACLNEWRRDCIDWCYDRLENNKFADQKYLEKWSQQYDGVYEIDIIGCGVAPWNLNSYTFSYFNDCLYINGRKIIFYHYHGLRMLNKNIVSSGLLGYNNKNNRLISKYIYKPYIKALYNIKNENDAQIMRYQTRSLFKTVLSVECYIYINNIIVTNSLLIKIIRNFISIKKYLEHGKTH